MPDYKKLIKKNKSSKKPKPVPLVHKKIFSKIALALMLGMLIVGAFYSLRSLLLNFSDFKVKKVIIVDAEGRPLPNPQGILRLDDDLSLFNLDMEKLAQDIQARHPEFISVSMRKQFPNTVAVIVRKRMPVAIVGTQKTCLVDEQGFVLPYESSFSHLPKIIDIHPRQIQLYTQSASLRLKKALALLKELKKAKIYPEYNVSQIDIRKYSDVVFYFENGIEVKMGEGDFTRKTILLSEILAQLDPGAKVPKYIDMRFGNPTVMP